MKHFVKGKVGSEKVILICFPTNQIVIKIYWQNHYHKSSLVPLVVYSLFKHLKEKHNNYMIIQCKNMEQWRCITK